MRPRGFLRQGLKARRYSLFLLLASFFWLGRPLDPVIGQTFVRGDSNGDGLVNVADPLFTVDYQFCGGPTPPCLKAADADSSCTVDLSDLTFTMNYLANCGTAPDKTSPPCCGTDTTSCTNPTCITSTDCSKLPSKAPSNPLFAFAFVHTPPPPSDTPPLVLPPRTCVFTDVAVTITNTSNTLSVAAWSISIKALSCRIISATTAGTIVPATASATSRVSSCGKGATSVVFISPILPSMPGDPCKDPGWIAPQSGPQTVLKLKVAVNVGVPFTLSFVNGQTCCPLVPCPPVHVPNVVATTALAGLSTAPAAGFEPVLVPATLTVPGGTQLFNTPVGKNVLVCCSTDPDPNVWLIFDEVTAAGNTTCQKGCVSGVNFWGWGGGVLCTRISTNAGYLNVNPTNITVCMRYKCTYSGPVSLFHWDGTNWNIVPGTTDPCAHVFCGRVKSLSEFILAIPPEAVPFRRADANGDGLADLSDAILILGCQFLGSACPACVDAADVNDDGRLDIADAIWLLSWNFLGTSPPPPPGPFACGADPTEDSLQECMNYPDFSHPEAACFGEEDDALN